MQKPNVIALDLEGTLISNAVSQIPRPGLHAFLEFCANAVPRLVVFTSVRESVFRNVAQVLAEDGAVPRWFPGLEYVTWSGPHKDLQFIAGAQIGSAVLIDDFAGYVLPGQEHRWLEVRPYSTPYPDDDAELGRVQEVLRRVWGCGAI